MSISPNNRNVRSNRTAIGRVEAWVDLTEQLGRLPKIRSIPFGEIRELIAASRATDPAKLEMLVHNLPPAIPRRPLNDDKPDGYRESDHDFVCNNIELCVGLLERLTNDDAALTGAAE